MYWYVGINSKCCKRLQCIVDNNDRSCFLLNHIDVESPEFLASQYLSVVLIKKYCLPLTWTYHHLYEKEVSIAVVVMLP